MPTRGTRLRPWLSSGVRIREMRRSDNRVSLHDRGRGKAGWLLHGHDPEATPPTACEPGGFCPPGTEEPLEENVGSALALGNRGLDGHRALPG